MRVILIEKEGTKTEVWTKLTELCQKRPEMRYHTLKKKRFPFEYRGYRFDKIEVNTKR